MRTLDVVTDIAAIEARLRNPAGPTRTERADLARRLATVRTRLLLEGATAIDPRAALVAAIEAAARRGVPYPELVGLFNDTLDRTPKRR